MPLPYKTILLTGASSGIGLAFAERFLSTPGTTVIAVSRTATKNPDLAVLRSKHLPGTLHLVDFDCTNLAGIPSWAASMTSTHPSLDCVVLNAGIQRIVDFTNPSGIDLAACDEELTLNYASPLHMSVAFLPHLIGRAPHHHHNPPSSSSSSSSAAALVFVTSGLAVLPMPTVPNYCASKAAVHSLAWSMRAQLGAAAGGAADHVRVIEVLPPAVHTRLHDGQPQAVHDNLARVAMTIDDFMADLWPDLEKGELDEVPVGGVKARIMSVETEKRNMFELMKGMLKKPT